MLTVDDIMLCGKIYGAAVSRMYNEIPVRVAPCHCGADIDQHCRGPNGREGNMPHADRRTAAQAWKKENPDEWEELKQELIRYYVELMLCDLSSQK